MNPSLPSERAMTALAYTLMLMAMMMMRRLTPMVMTCVMMVIVRMTVKAVVVVMATVLSMMITIANVKPLPALDFVVPAELAHAAFESNGLPGEVPSGARGRPGPEPLEPAAQAVCGRTPAPSPAREPWRHRVGGAKAHPPPPICMPALVAREQLLELVEAALELHPRRGCR